MSETVAVVVPCFNYGRYVEEALRCLAAQTRRPAEVVVVDDGSTDDTPQVVLRVAAELAGRLPVRLVRTGNRGLAAAVARGMAETAAPLVTVVSADDRVMPDFVAQLADALEADPAAGYAYPRVRMFGDESGTCVSYPYDVDRLLFDHNFVPAIALMRRAAFASTGGLSGLPAHEDWDLFLAFAEHGWRGVLVPQVLAEWRRHPGARNELTLRRRLGLRVLIVARHRRLVLRRAHMAIPWTLYAGGRRVAARLWPRGVASVRSASGWVQVDS